MDPPYHYITEAAEAARTAATQANTQPRQSEHPVGHSTMPSSSQDPNYSLNTTSEFPNMEERSAAHHNGLADEANTQGELQVPANSDANNPASNAEPNPDGNSKTAQITARVEQLKGLLVGRGDRYVPYIRSEGDLEEFEEAMELLDLDEQREDLSAGYPLTEAEFEAHCHVLFDAMKNLVNIDEVVAARNQASGTRKRDNLPVRFVKSKKGIEVNIVAGKLMRAMRKAQRGQLSLAGKKLHEYGSFTLRFRAVADALMVSKTLVKSAFESDEWVNRIAINPAGELQRKRANKIINDQKNEKEMFATEMKKKDPTINFKTATNKADATKAPESAATGNPADQAQQSIQGLAIPSDQGQTNPPTSPAPRRVKRAKTSHQQVDEPEGHDGQPTFAPDGRLNLDPNPFRVLGPTRQYGYGSLYRQADSEFYAPLPSAWDGFEAIGPDESQQNQPDQDEDDRSMHYDG